jgi:hypothetical protein
MQSSGCEHPAEPAACPEEIRRANCDQHAAALIAARRELKEEMDAAALERQVPARLQKLEKP